MYVDKARAKGKQIDAKLAKMHGKADEVIADVKLGYLKQVDKIKDEKDGLKGELKKLKKSGEKSWGKMEKGTEKAWDKLKKSVAKETDKSK